MLGPYTTTNSCNQHSHKFAYQYLRLMHVAYNSLPPAAVTFMPHFAKTKCVQGIKHEAQQTETPLASHLKT